MIPFFDYGPEYRRHAAAIDAAVQRVLASGQLILGPEVEAFESEFARAMGVQAAVGVASGTDALSLALRALDVGPGSEVITTANAGAPPVAAIRATGAVPVFVDVDPETLTMDPAAAAAAVGSRTACLLVVHLYGRPAALQSLLQVARAGGLPLVEDCAQAHGARADGIPVGSRGTLGCFSFYPTKNLGAFGDGGAVAGNDPALLERVRRMRMYGFEPGERRACVEGVNSRLDEIQAAMLRVKLPHLDEVNRERRALAARYDAVLANSPLVPVGTRPGDEPVYHLYVIRCEDRVATLQGLTRSGIGHGLHYEHPAHAMPAYRGFGPPLGALPVTERACASVVSLPLYPGLPEDVFDRLERCLADASS